MRALRDVGAFTVFLLALLLPCVFLFGQEIERAKPQQPPFRVYNWQQLNDDVQVYTVMHQGSGECFFVVQAVKHSEGGFGRDRSVSDAVALSAVQANWKVCHP